MPHFRNVHAVAVAIAARDPTKNVAALEQEAKRSSGIQWFLRKFNSDSYNKLSAFKAARIMCLEATQWLQPTPATVHGLDYFIMACEKDKVKW